MTRILLVEDNEMNRDMLSRRLKQKGYEVAITVAGHGRRPGENSGGWLRRLRHQTYRI